MAIYRALELREELDGELPKQVGFYVYYAGSNKTSYYEQNESFDERGPEMPGKQAEHNKSYAEGKRKPKNQDEHNVSSALPDVKIRLQSAVGKQSDRMFIVDSGASFHLLSSTDLTAAEKKSRKE